MRQLERNPFARATLVKDAQTKQVACKWCGGYDGKGLCYRYYWQGDTGSGMIAFRHNFNRFCSKSCFRSFYS